MVEKFLLDIMDSTSFNILNHSLEIIPIPDYFIYFPAGAIIILHFYNMQFCKCANDSCCASKIID